MRSYLVSKTLLLPLAVACCCIANGQEAMPVATEVAQTALDESGKLVRFERDIAPILRNRCLECHGPDDAKEDFRVDDPEVFLEFVEAGDVESSTLYIDYLTTEDEDLLMPPKAKQGPLSAAELALIRVWIDEGANWPEGFQLSDVQTEPEPPRENAQSVADRVWRAIGYLHPATIHFPIALFLLGAVFTVVGWKWPAVGTQIPLACLLIGTMFAIASTAMGWSLAPTKGYGEGWTFLSFQRDVDAHRWSGVIVTLIACLSSIIAIMAYWKDSIRLHRIWRIGLLFCGIAVGLVGHQGGEMTYGRDFYPEMFRVLIGQNDLQPADQSGPAIAADTIQTVPTHDPANDEK